MTRRITLFLLVTFCFSAFQAEAQKQGQPPQYYQNYEILYNEIHNAKTHRYIVRPFDSEKQAGKLEMYGFQLVDSRAYAGYLFASGRVYNKKDHRFTYGSLWIRLNDDDTYTEIVPFGKYDSSTYYGDDVPIPVFKCKKGDLYSIVDGNGKVFFEGAQEVDYRIINGKMYNYAVWPDGKKTMVDQEGNQMFSEYDSALPLGGSIRIKVCRDGRWGLVSLEGEPILPLIYRENELAAALERRHLESFSLYVQSDVQRLKTTKDEFETEAEFQARKSDPALQEAYVREMTKEQVFPFAKYVSKVNNGTCRFSLGEYNADVAAFALKSNFTPRVTYWFTVPRAEARAFKDQFVNMTILLHTIKFFIQNDGLSFSEIHMRLPDGTEVKYENPEAKNYDGKFYDLPSILQ